MEKISARERAMLWAILRALRSSLVIGSVALGAFAWREGYFTATGLKSAFAEDWPLFAVLFVAVLGVDWFRRKKKKSPPPL